MGFSIIPNNLLVTIRCCQFQDVAGRIIMLATFFRHVFDFSIVKQVRKESPVNIFNWSSIWLNKRSPTSVTDIDAVLMQSLIKGKLLNHATILTSSQVEGKMTKL